MQEVGIISGAKRIFDLNGGIYTFYLEGEQWSVILRGEEVQKMRKSEGEVVIDFLSRQGYEVRG